MQKESNLLRNSDSKSMQTSKSLKMLSMKRRSLGEALQKTFVKPASNMSEISSPQISFILDSKLNSEKSKPIRSKSNIKERRNSLSRSENRLIGQSKLKLKHAKDLNETLDNSLSSICTFNPLDINSRLKVPVISNKSLTSINESNVKHKHQKGKEPKSDKELLDFKLSQELQKNSGDFRAFQNIFEKIIEKDKEFGPLLRKVKDGYENCISKLEQEKMNLQIELKKCRKLINEKSSKTNLDFQNLAKENQRLMKREKKYLRILSDLKLKGFPIEESLSSRKITKLQLSDSFLKQEDVQTSTSSYKISLRQSEEKNQRPNYLNKTASVPKLSIFNSSTQNFQEEFMSNYDQFSES